LEKGNWKIDNGKWFAADERKRGRKDFTTEVAEWPQRALRRVEVF
jgi:hypothetical protein